METQKEATKQDDWPRVVAGNHLLIIGAREDSGP